ncbi:hypothetical protein [Zobellia alginiliquefaciens]|uniref:hypothetical protein n=1 Tax=Zobellia alginiliquefaciens TaxID=3032586 RepID=UPI0023E424C1|nr:hypothetical protein [Zobellia alginiliquefaciens]
MITLVRIIFFLLCAAIGKAQNPVLDLNLGQYQLAKSSKFYTNGFAYPVFMDNEMHTQATIGYQFDDNFMMELQNYYNTYRTHDLHRAELELKYYLNNKLYLFSGVAIEKSLDKHGQEAPKPQFMLTNGVGYEVKTNTMMEARYDLNINKNENKAPGKSSMFSVLSKFKF